MDELELFQYTNLEYAQWTNVVAEFIRLGIDVNDHKYDPLMRAIELWAERCVALRLNQDPDIIERALNEHIVSYREACESRGPQ